MDREPLSSLGGCAATAVLGGDSQGEMTQLVLSFLTGQNLQPLGHLCSLPLDLLRSVPSFLNCGDQNKDLNVKVSQCDLYHYLRQLEGFVVKIRDFYAALVCWKVE